jgi:uncharacterized cupin superfamily protein
VTVDRLQATGVPTASPLMQPTTATPYRRRAIPYPRYEMMYFLAGATSFPEADGKLNDVAAGETAIIPHGFVAEWWNKIPVRKVACNFFVS